MKKTFTIISSFIVVMVFGIGVVLGSIHGTFEGYPIVQVEVDGGIVEGDVPAVNLEGRTMVPLRFVSEELGAEVDWDGERETAVVTTDEAEKEITDPEPESDLDSDLVELEEGQVAKYFDENPIRWEHEDGLELEVQGIQFISREHFNEEYPDAVDGIEERTIVMFHVWAKNNTGSTIS